MRIETLFIALFLWSFAHAQVWHAQEVTTMGGILDDSYTAVKPLPTGGEVLGGYISGTVDLGPGTQVSAPGGGAANFIGKRDGANNWDWVKVFGSSLINGSFGIDLALGGEIRVSMSVDANTQFDGQPIGATEPALANLKLNPTDGSLIDAFFIPAEQAFAYQKVLASGNVLIIGAPDPDFPGFANIPNGPSFTTAGQPFIVCLDPDGQYLWSTELVGAAEWIYPYPVELPNGDLVFNIVYSEDGCEVFGETFDPPLNFDPSAPNVYGLIRVSAAGEALWTIQPTNTSAGYLSSAVISTTPTGGVQLLAQITDAITLGGTNVSGNGQLRIMVHGDGTVQSFQQLETSNVIFGHAKTMADGSSVVLGQFYDYFDLGSTPPFGGISVEVSDYEPVFIAGMNAAGNWTWAYTMVAENYDWSVGINADAEDRVYLNGSYTSVTTFGGTPLPQPFSGRDAFLLKFAPTCMAATATNVLPAACPFASNGSLGLIVQGGVAPYSTLWDDGSTASLRQDLSSGIHNVVINDSDTCSAELTVYVPGPLSGTGQDLTGAAFPLPYFRPGVPTDMLAAVIEQGCAEVAAQFRMVLDPMVSYVSGLGPTDMINGDTVLLDMGVVEPASILPVRSIVLETDVAAQIGDSVCFLITILPVQNDENLVDNQLAQCYPIVNSYDPNDKQVTPKGIGPAGTVAPETELTYLIRFQNTGNAPAFNVHIDDTLNTNLILGDLRVIASSHPMALEIVGDHILRFRFDDINLADSLQDEANSHGYVLYSIPIRDGLPTGTMITNTAYIYFDLNAPVITNTTLNTIDVLLGVVQHNSASSIMKAWPNPFTHALDLSFPPSPNGHAVLVTDTQGRVVLQKRISGNTTTLDTSGWAEGVYFVRGGDQCVRVVKVD